MNGGDFHTLFQGRYKKVDCILVSQSGSLYMYTDGFSGCGGGQVFHVG